MAKPLLLLLLQKKLGNISPLVLELPPIKGSVDRGCNMARMCFPGPSSQGTHIRNLGSQADHILHEQGGEERHKNHDHGNYVGALECEKQLRLQSHRSRAIPDHQGDSGEHGTMVPRGSQGHRDPVWEYTREIKPRCLESLGRGVES